MKDSKQATNEANDEVNIKGRPTLKRKLTTPAKTDAERQRECRIRTKLQNSERQDGIPQTISTTISICPYSIKLKGFSLCGALEIVRPTHRYVRKFQHRLSFR